jgi:membrane-bound metal-dependent hydrolase YbcI (DUF457 family)
MFIGHYAIGYFSRRRDSLPSLAILFLAVQLLDLLWPIFVLLGWESFTIDPGNTRMTPLSFNHYPYSHSLLMSVVWGILFSVLYYFFKKNAKASFLIFILVLSHWILDFITHRADLQLTPFTEQRVGLALWNHPALELILELSMFITGILFYYFNIKPARKITFWILAGLFIVIHLMNVFGPPPPSVEAVAWSANLMWLFIIWAWWVERPVSASSKV